MEEPRNDNEEEAPENGGQHHNRCFTYPQGQASIIPQLLTLMAAVASLLVWPFLGYSENFGCIEYTGGGFGCTPLYLNHPNYWSGSDEQDGWAGALQAAAVFAIFSTALGFVSFALLVTATCFVLEPRKILYVLIMQGVAAFLSIMTLVGAAADICKIVAPGSTTCSREGFRVDTGAGFEIFAFLLYLAALAMTLLWYKQVRPSDANECDWLCPCCSNQERAKAPTTEMHSAARPASVTIVELPNGGRRIEREYVDEQGQTVRETTIEQEYRGEGDSEV